MVDTSIEELRCRFLAERSHYRNTACAVAERIDFLTRSNGIRCDVQWRVKEVSSFLKKILRKRHSYSYDDIKDKAGVRVIAHYPWDIDKIENLVQEAFAVSHYDDKRADASFQTLDYRGLTTRSNSIGDRWNSAICYARYRCLLERRVYGLIPLINCPTNRWCLRQIVFKEQFTDSSP